MFEAIKYVISENCSNLYRIYSIAKYTVLADMRDSKLGWFWNFANPLIQVLTYWFVFGYVFNRGDVDGMKYLPWMLGGIVVWFYINPCITDGANAIFKQSNVISRMKFPVSILPMTVVVGKLFDHLCLFVIVIAVFAGYGYYPSVYWLGLIYYLFCAVIFAFALSLTTSVLNMIARDTRKLILACMRLLLYLTPILWNIERVRDENIQMLLKINPIYYLVQGYRDCFFYHKGFAAYGWSAMWFWIITAGLFLWGSYMMYKFKTKFVDML